MNYNGNFGNRLVTQNELCSTSTDIIYTYILYISYLVTWLHTIYTLHVRTCARTHDHIICQKPDNLVTSQFNHYQSSHFYGYQVVTNQRNEVTSC